MKQKRKMKKSTKIIIGIILAIAILKIPALMELLISIIGIVVFGYLGIVFIGGIILASIFAIISALSGGGGGGRPVITCMRGVDKSVAGCIGRCEGCEWRRGHLCNYF